MGKYVIQTRTVDNKGDLTPPVFLEPFVHANLYSHRSIVSAVEHMRENPHVEMVAIRIDARAYTISVVTPVNEIGRKYLFDFEGNHV